MKSQEKASNAKPVFPLPPNLLGGDHAHGRSLPPDGKPSLPSTLALVSNNGAAAVIQDSSGAARLAAPEAVQKYELDHAKPLDPNSFPNQPRVPNGQILPTIANFQHLLKQYKIAVSYNVIKKKLEIFVRGHSGSFDNRDNVLLAQIFSVAALNGFPLSQIPNLLVAVGDRNLWNPVANWINSRRWDGVDRRQAFYDTLVEREDFPKRLKETLMYRWALSPVAAALMPSEFRCRGVLTLQGTQGIGKTAWVSSLVPDAELRSQVVLLNHHLDGGNKDSITTAASHWLVEIGELDGSFKKDIARLKGFLTAATDKVRRPYGRMDSEYPRRTVFCATVNEANFLVDPTGNSRWWTIPVTSINYEHGIDMQQLFAQLAIDFDNGQQWWLTPEEERLLEQQNNAHRVSSAIRERILNSVEMEPKADTALAAMTAIELLQSIGFQFPTNPQCKECAGVLRELFGDPKKVNGRFVWRISLRHQKQVSTPQIDDDDLY
jgi:putative DNA primase/helicase